MVFGKDLLKKMLKPYKTVTIANKLYNLLRSVVLFPENRSSRLQLIENVSPKKSKKCPRECNGSIVKVFSGILIYGFLPLIMHDFAFMCLDHGHHWDMTAERTHGNWSKLTTCYEVNRKSRNSKSQWQNMHVCDFVHNQEQNIFISCNMWYYQLNVCLGIFS